jgi:hypothetical protein
MKPGLRSALFLLTLLSPLACCGSEPTIVFDPSIDKNNLAPWLAYAGARKAYIAEHHSPLPRSGDIQPSFDEEVSARRVAIGLYQVLRETAKTAQDPYWETLAKVEAQGFLKAYVWKYHHRPNWPAKSKPSNSAAFENWRRTALANHSPQTCMLLRVD